jgi:hypothetical protein
MAKLLLILIFAGALADWLSPSEPELLIDSPQHRATLDGAR